MLFKSSTRLLRPQTCPLHGLHSNPLYNRNQHPNIILQVTHPYLLHPHYIQYKYHNFATPSPTTPLSLIILHTLSSTTSSPSLHNPSISPSTSTNDFALTVTHLLPSPAPSPPLPTTSSPSTPLSPPFTTPLTKPAHPPKHLLASPNQGNTSAKQCGIASYSSTTTLTPCAHIFPATNRPSSANSSQPKHIHTGGAPRQDSARMGLTSGWPHSESGAYRWRRGGDAGQAGQAGRRRSAASCWARVGR